MIEFLFASCHYRALYWFLQIDDLYKVFAQVRVSEWKEGIAEVLRNIEFHLL